MRHGGDHEIGFGQVAVKLIRLVQLHVGQLTLHPCLDADYTHAELIAQARRLRADAPDAQNQDRRLRQVHVVALASLLVPAGVDLRAVEVWE